MDGKAEPVLPRRVLIAEDDDLQGQHLKRLVEHGQDCHAAVVRTGDDALAELQTGAYQVAVVDLRMPRRDGMEVIDRVRQLHLPVTIIVVSGYGTIEQAVEAMQRGAHDFLTKPIDPHKLEVVLARAWRERALEDELLRLKTQLRRDSCFHGMLSKSPAMHAVFELITVAAAGKSTVLIEGETGTGKERVARAIHQSSGRRDKPFVATSCAALPGTLLESELFGSEKGSFTGSVARRLGRFELAHGGTLFLDEIGDMPLTMQAKLLRVLQERRFERVGGTETVETDVRVVAATNRPMHSLVSRRQFRQDLFYRLNVIRVDLPPLRQRTEDIPLLANHFVLRHALNGICKSIAPEAMDVLVHYSWPGNVRELENVIERALHGSPAPVIQPEHLPPEVSAAKPEIQFDLDRPLPALLHDIVGQIERHYISAALAKAQGNVSRCARICGFSRRSLFDKLAKHRLRNQAAPAYPPPRQATSNPWVIA